MQFGFIICVTSLHFVAPVWELKTPWIWKCRLPSSRLHGIITWRPQYKWWGLFLTHSHIGNLFNQKLCTKIDHLDVSSSQIRHFNTCSAIQSYYHFFGLSLFAFFSCLFSNSKVINLYCLLAVLWRWKQHEPIPEIPTSSHRYCGIILS
jgi:hypothetical protein